MTESALIDPRTLTSSEKRALKLCAAGRVFKRTGGWVAAHGGRIANNVADSMKGRGLLRSEFSGMNGQLLVLTGNGRNTHNVLVERENRRKLGQHEAKKFKQW